MYFDITQNLSRGSVLDKIVDKTDKNMLWLHNSFLKMVTVQQINGCIFLDFLWQYFDFYQYVACTVSCGIFEQSDNRI